MIRGILILLGLLLAHPVTAQDYVVGESGWHLERLSDDFVVLRTDIQQVKAGALAPHKGLLMLTCERQARRVRFQIGSAPRLPSTQNSELGRARVRGERDGRFLILKSASPRVRFFEDGSFEFLEAIGFSDAVMREFLELLQQVPERLELLLFKGNETRAFLRGTAHRFYLVRLEENLGAVYGFEGLCFRKRKSDIQHWTLRP